MFSENPWPDRKTSDAMPPDPQDSALYQEVVLRHHRNPFGEGLPVRTDREARVVNPLCGDEVTVHLRIDQDRITEARFTAQACAVCRASASLLCRMIEGREAAEATAKIVDFQSVIASGGWLDAADWDEVSALDAVREFPARRRCILLPWEAAQSALA